MRLLLVLGWRNIWRNKRRTILTILAVTFATMLSISMRGIQIGTWEANIRHIVRMFAGHAQIQVKEYNTNPSLQMYFPYDEGIRRLIRNNERIVASTPRVYGDGLVCWKDNSLGVMILGIAPATECSVSTFQNRVVAGRFLTDDDVMEIVVGWTLLKNLNASVGDTVVLLAQGADGTLGNFRYTITGAVKSGSPDLDGMAVFMGIGAARQLLGLEGVHAVVLRVRDLPDVPIVRRELTASLQGTKLTALAWDDILSDLKQHMQIDTISAVLFLGILMIIVAFGILNTVLMSVTERFREFGVALSIGMPPKLLVRLILIESVFLTVAGLVLGNLIAFGINYYIVQHPILLSGDFGSIYEDYGFVPRIESSLRFHIFANSSLSVLVISLLACLYPALRAYRLEPLKGLRYT